MFTCLIKSQSLLLALRGFESFTGQHAGGGLSSARDSEGLSDRDGKCGQPPPQSILAVCLLEQNLDVRDVDFLCFFTLK